MENPYEAPKSDQEWSLWSILIVGVLIPGLPSLLIRRDAKAFFHFFVLSGSTLLIFAIALSEVAQDWKTANLVVWGGFLLFLLAYLEFTSVFTALHDRERVRRACAASGDELPGEQDRFL